MAIHGSPTQVLCSPAKSIGETVQQKAEISKQNSFESSQKSSEIFLQIKHFCVT